MKTRLQQLILSSMMVCLVGGCTNLLPWKKESSNEGALSQLKEQNQENQELQSQLNEANDELGVLKTQLSEASNTVCPPCNCPDCQFDAEPKTQLSQEIQKVKEERDALKTQLNQAQKSLETLKSENTQLQEKVAQHTEQANTNCQETALSDTAKNHIKKLKQQLHEAEKRCETHPEVLRLDKEIAKIEQENIGLRRQIEKLTAQLKNCPVPP